MRMDRRAFTFIELLVVVSI
ncbi:MAG: prepilin-type N-terminal cleavage/methylation domain-containing protein, partial [Phycisphaeraceae bacterium]